MLSTGAPPSMRGNMAAKKEKAEDGKQGLMLRLPKRLHSALRHVSIDRERSLNTLITDVLEDWWSKQPERAKYTPGAAPKRRGR